MNDRPSDTDCGHRPAPRTAVDASAIAALYRSESRAVLATLIRLLGDFELAEEGLHEAFRAALERWPADGLPANPRSWLISAGRFRMVDRLRRQSRFEPFDADRHGGALDAPAADDGGPIEDDRLRLVFTCCHPALGFDAQVALTLREVCGLTTEQVASAFLTPAPTLAQRIVRAKSKIRDARIPYEIPDADSLPERLDAVLRVVYLVFNEGYGASSGDTLQRPDLASEAIRLGRLLVELHPAAEAVGLLALMLLQDSRRDARSSADGELVLLEDQDRSRWNQAQIVEGCRLVERALATRPPGPYALQAAIAALHAEAASVATTDWPQVIGLYDLLLRIEPSPVVALNRAVAVGMRDGWAAGLVLVEQLLQDGALDDYRLAHAARADFCRRLGRVDDARASYRRALALTRQAAERRFLERRLAELDPR